MKPTQENITGYYNRMSVMTAPSGKRITMLHDRCVELISFALKADKSDRRHNLNKAQNILAQLQAALKSRDEVGQSLFHLYDYSFVLLEKGSIRDCIHVREVLTVLCAAFGQFYISKSK